MSKINIPANSNPSLTLKSNPLQGLSSWLRHMAYKFPEDGPTLIDWAKEVAAVAAPTPPVDAVLGEPVAKLIVKREFHDNGQGPRDTEGYMMAIAVANSRAESLPIGDYALYIAAPVASRAVQAEPVEIPEGWKLVPTDHDVPCGSGEWGRMCLAAGRALRDHGFNSNEVVAAINGGEWNSSNLVRQIVKAVRSKAAPAAPAATAEHGAGRGGGEPVAWRVCSAFTGTAMFPARNTKGEAERDAGTVKTPTTIQPLYAAPLAPLTDASRELIAAAKAVIERWYTPTWRDVPHTSTLINRLRDALSAFSAGVEGTGS